MTVVYWECCGRDDGNPFSAVFARQGREALGRVTMSDSRV